MYMQPTNAIKNLMQDWGTHTSSNMNQQVFNKQLKASNMSRESLQILPFGSYPPGKWVQEHPNPSVYHANWIVGIDEKVKFFKDRSLWKLPSIEERQLYSSVFQSGQDPDDRDQESGVCVEVFKDCVAACTLPDLSTLVPDHTIGAPTIHTKAAFDGTFPLNWAARFTGKLWIETPGEYTFQLEIGQADSAQLFVDGIPVVTNACVDQASNVSTIATEGLHEIIVIYGDDGFHDHLRLMYQGPDTKTEKKIIEESAWEKQNCRVTKPVAFPPGKNPVCAQVYPDCVDGCQLPNLYAQAPVLAVRLENVMNFNDHVTFCKDGKEERI